MITVPQEFTLKPALVDGLTALNLLAPAVAL